MSVLDKPKFSANDVIKLAITIGSIGSMWYNLKLDNNDLKGQISELKTYKNADDKVINSRVENLELLSTNMNNRTTEIEKDIIRLLAILPNRAEVPKLKEHEDN